MIGHSRPAPFDLADNGPTGLNSYVSPYEAKPLSSFDALRGTESAFTRIGCG